MKYKELINTNIKKLRQHHNLTQEEFAEKIGLSINGVSNIERNRYQPTADTIDKICKAFEITLVELLLQKATSDKDLTENIIKLLSNCNSKQLKKIYEIIKILLK